ncbi:PI-PLC X domain-containing protein [Tolypocladium ophioglossoides CBS 100239]|uniref:PI-PLC X domain-containing protein n=1 Tax=Tolypocladium ophioglossoides (strain CBS 100239) TaxID=1163406 RepID=A0A0L0N6N0_TOLOC|nr:PI-PLC X domain-containing protein [Tolypocladium ophioglossoides CBS 100239]
MTCAAAVMIACIKQAVGLVGGLAACAPKMQLPLLLPLAATALAACNGRAELCGRRYSDVAFIGTHNSAFVGETPVHNQLVSVTEQLDGGVRFLQAQTHNKEGVIEMCHTSCWELDVGPLTLYLQEIAAWMNGHADEVVTLLLTNMDGIAVDKFDAAFGSSGLKKYVFRPRGIVAKDQWPTLQELINAGTRLIVFMDYHADQTKVDYIISEFSYYWETPYGITDRNFPTCSVDRPSGGDPTKLMGIMNHMLNFKIGDIVFPDMPDAGNTNSLASIQKQVDLCKSQGKPRPNVVLLDWVNIGDAQKAQLVLNGLS